MSPWRQSRLILAEIVDLAGTLSKHGAQHLARLIGQPPPRSTTAFRGFIIFAPFAGR
jgi:hypothetical protein